MIPTRAKVMFIYMIAAVFIGFIICFMGSAIYQNDQVAAGGFLLLCSGFGAGLLELILTFCGVGQK